MELFRGAFRWYVVPVSVLALFLFLRGWPYYPFGRTLEAFIEALIVSVAVIGPVLFVVRNLYEFATGFISGYSRELSGDESRDDE